MGGGPGVAGLRSAYAEGATTPERVVAAIFDRIERRGLRPAWISLVDRNAALARAAEVGGLDAPLAGVPFAVKDNIDVAGMETTAGCPGYARVTGETAPVVQQLLDAGAVLVGKTNLDQFATGLVGTRSPYGTVLSAADPEYVAGGSSSGSAVVVADGTVAFSLGTDTAGSGRVPAAFNAIVGLKPTRGLVSTRWVVPASRSLDCVSIFTRTVGDAAGVLAVAAVFDPLDPWSRRAPAPVAARWPPRIGVPPAAALRDLDDRHAAAWEEARARAGEMLVEIDFAPFAEAATLLYDGPWLAERWLAAGAAIDAEVDGLDPIVAGVVRRGREARATDLFRAVHRLAELRREVERTFAEVDVLLLPTAPTVPTPADVAADPVGVNRRLGAWTNGVNLLDLCALAVPGPAADGGPPFGVSLVAPAFSEPLLVELGAWWTGEASMPAPRAAGTEILLAVVGAHLRGEPLNGELTGRGARFVRATRTAPDYRLVALPGGPPERPGLLRAPGEAGPGIELELWSLSPAALGSLLAGVPAPLVIGTVELEDGGTVLGFLCEAHAAAAALDITEHGGWRAYRRAPASSAA